MSNMIEMKDIEKLAALARIRVTDEEKESLRKDIDSVLAYVDQVKQASLALGDTKDAGVIRNVMREDSEPHETGAFTKELIEESPKKEGDYVKVKKIL